MLLGFLLTASAFLATLIRLCALLFGSHDHQEKAASDLDIFTDETNRVADKLAAEAKALADEVKPLGGER